MPLGFNAFRMTKMIEIRKYLPETEANGPADSCPIDSSGKGSECGTSLWKPPKFDLRFLFLVLTLTAIWLALQRVQNVGSMSVISIIMLTFMFGCPRTRKAVLTVVPALYLPFVWLLVYIVPFNAYHRACIQAWGHLPGLLPSGFFWNPPGTELVAATTTVVLFFAGVLALRFSNVSRWVVAIPTAAMCSWSSLMCFAFFRI